MSNAPIAGIEPEPVTEWLAARVPVEVPLRFELIAGGHSNLTYRVHDAGSGRWVLRRPPLHQVLATAHDMGREHRIISALADTAVPVPATVGFCDDASVTGAPFYVMDEVEGIVARSTAIAAELEPAARTQVSRRLAEVLAEIHRVDLVAVGLDSLGRPDAYVERQLRRWMRQFDDSRTTERPEVAALHAALEQRIPEQGPATLVHGDYRLDNCIVSADGEVLAVLDWELCTLGDPLVDLAQLLTYWAEPGDELTALDDSPTTVDGFADRAALAGFYADASGRDIGVLDYHLAFASWRLACILEGVYSRYLSGAMGDVPADVHDFDVRIRGLLTRAGAHLEALG
ncbi:MAG: phosphotransferase family protein [Acidimicrobiales bacterium]